MGGEQHKAAGGEQHKDVGGEQHKAVGGEQHKALGGDTEQIPQNTDSTAFALCTRQNGTFVCPTGLGSDYYVEGTKWYVVVEEVWRHFSGPDRITRD